MLVLSNKPVGTHPRPSVRGRRTNWRTA